MSAPEHNGNYWLRKRTVATSTPAAKVSKSQEKKNVAKRSLKSRRTMLSHVPLASEDEYVVSVPDEESSSDSDESDCEKALNPDRETSTISLPVPDTTDEASREEEKEGGEEIKQDLEEKPEEIVAETNIDAEADVIGTNITQTAARQAERFVRKVKEAAWRWRVTHHNLLPDWLKDNDFLHFGHRPQIPSFRSCFGSIFRIHTETGNIWTHLLGKGFGVFGKDINAIIMYTLTTGF